MLPLFEDHFYLLSNLGGFGESFPLFELTEGPTPCLPPRIVKFLDYRSHKMR